MIEQTPAWAALRDEATRIAPLHLRDLLQDNQRVERLTVHKVGVYADFTRQNATVATLDKLVNLAKAADVPGRLRAMSAGEKINTTEHRAVLHTALRAPRGRGPIVDGQDVLADVHAVLDHIGQFSAAVRGGSWLGATGKPLTNTIAIGIGGSYLGPEFMAEALRHHPACAQAAAGRTLRFLANVDPTDVHRTLLDLDPERTLVVIISKTFTTAETMLNARCVRQWLTDRLGPAAVAKHMVAVSTNLKEVSAFGIDPAHTFAFWDWVGGRYSVTSAVGVLPLALYFGMGPVQEILAGAHAMDRHALDAPIAENLPILLGLFGIWNATFLDRPARAILPYSQALHRFAAHIQQVDMESNGKRVDVSGRVLPFSTGEVDFGEPGTNGQHSFYQLIHQGRIVPADFIGFCRSQTPIQRAGEIVANHDELMANFFAQPDALACGKTAQELGVEGCQENLIPHREFPGNRPSTVLLLNELDASACGKLLALYEHRTAVQGFIWGVNSFDQWGVELGKVLANRARKQLAASRSAPQNAMTGFNPATTKLMTAYLSGSV